MKLQPSVQNYHYRSSNPQTSPQTFNLAPNSAESSQGPVNPFSGPLSSNPPADRQYSSFKDRFNPTYEYNLPRMQGLLHNRGHVLRERLKGAETDSLKASAYRSHVRDLHSFHRSDLLTERANQGGNWVDSKTSLRLKLLAPLFDVEKDEDNPYSLAAVYRHKLSKQKMMDRGKDNEKKKYFRDFDQTIKEKYEGGIKGSNPDVLFEKFENFENPKNELQNEKEALRSGKSPLKYPWEALQRLEREDRMGEIAEEVRRMGIIGQEAGAQKAEDGWAGRGQLVESEYYAE